MLTLKNSIQKLFPKTCLACEGSFEPLEVSEFICKKCQSEIKLKTQARCLVCFMDRLGCLLCKGFPLSPKPSWIQVALESTPTSHKLIEASYRPSGWLLHRALANLFYARFLCSCELSPTHLIALPDPNGYFGISSYHLDLAKELAKKQKTTVMSWNRARFYQAKATDRLLLVGFQAELETLIGQASKIAWTHASYVGALVGLMETKETIVELKELNK